MSIGAAGAADVSAPVTKAPVKATAPLWSGFYAGGNIGYGWESSSVGLPVSTTDPALAGALAFLIGNGSFPAAMSPSAHGVIGGGQIGYNWQWQSQWLVGLEADLQGSGVRGSETQTLTPLFSDATSTSMTKSIDWFGTVRGRIGYLVSPQWLVYATGGLAYGETKIGFSHVDVTSGCIAQATICANATSSEVRVGWTAGAGVEAMIAANWSFKAEYLYLDLGRHSANITAYTVPIVFSPSTDFRQQIVRVGVNYHFN